MSTLGKSINNFNIPVCDKFRPTILDGQRCYQVNANEMQDDVDKDKIASQGIVLLLDYNLDRMVKFEGYDKLTMDNSSILEKNIKNTNDAMIYRETLGNNCFQFFRFSVIFLFKGRLHFKHDSVLKCQLYLILTPHLLILLLSSPYHRMQPASYKLLLMA